MQEIRRKNHTLTRARLYVFDLLALTEFNSGVGDTCFAERYMGTMHF